MQFPCQPAPESARPASTLSRAVRKFDASGNLLTPVSTENTAACYAVWNQASTFVIAAKSTRRQAPPPFNVYARRFIELFCTRQPKQSPADEKIF
jgi:hypothetical protein